MAELPVDKGWAWVVAFGAFLDIFMIYGMFRVMGVVFLEMTNLFNVSSALTATMFVGLMVGQIITLPVYPILLKKMGCRKLAICGATCIFMAYSLQIFCSNVYMFIAVFGLLNGFGWMVSNFVILIVLGMYFKEKLNLVSGLVFCASGLAQLIIPQLFNYVLSEYGIRGTLLITGACNLHLLIAAVIFRPPSFYAIKKKSTKLAKIKDNKDRCKIELSNMKVDNLYLENGIQNKSYIPEDNNSKMIPCYNDVEGFVNENQDAQKENKVNINVIHVSDERKNGTSVDGIGTHDENVQMSADHKSIKQTQVGAKNNQVKESVPVKQILLKDMYKQLLTSKLFWVFSTGRTFAFVGFTLILTFLPPYTNTSGFSSSQTALLLTILGAFDLPTRPFHGWVTSLKRVNCTVYTALTTLLGSGVILCCLTFKFYSSTYIMAIIWNITFAPISCLQAALYIDGVGRTHMPAALTIVMIKVTVLKGFLPIVFGWIYDVWQTYTPALYVGGALALISGVASLIQTRMKNEFIKPESTDL